MYTFNYSGNRPAAKHKKYERKKYEYIYWKHKLPFIIVFRIVGLLSHRCTLHLLFITKTKTELRVKHLILVPKYGIFHHILKIWFVFLAHTVWSHYLADHKHCHKLDLSTGNIVIPLTGTITTIVLNCTIVIRWVYQTLIAFIFASYSRKYSQYAVTFFQF